MDSFEMQQKNTPQEHVLESDSIQDVDFVQEDVQSKVAKPVVSPSAYTLVDLHLTSFPSGS